jgi:hypothetical protein
MKRYLFLITGISLSILLPCTRADKDVEFFITAPPYVAKVSAIQVGMGLGSALIPLGMGSQNVGSITVYSPLDHKMEAVAISSLLQASQSKTLATNSYAISNQSVLVAEGTPALFKKYPIKNLDPSASVVTPVAFNNRICVLFDPSSGQIGTDCVVTDVTSKQDVMKFRIESLPAAFCVDHMMWISDHQILCLAFGRRYTSFSILDLKSHTIIHDDQLKDVIYASFYNNQLMLFCTNENGVAQEKPFHPRENMATIPSKGL